ncbi:hypothetical protein [Paenibacillus tyrfis]|uniref:hypothetical protein n=1 Tax=Paenibacillus tyrfis TaxID=1501230 RepID=UPI000B58DAC5|nr:hypothetical protein [Paenibacillus tyrfis]
MDRKDELIFSALRGVADALVSIHRQLEEIREINGMLFDDEYLRLKVSMVDQKTAQLAWLLEENSSISMERLMTATELATLFERRINERSLQMPAAMIEYQGEKGIALYIGENLATGTWLNGDIIVHWEKGEHTSLPDEFSLIKDDLWSL